MTTEELLKKADLEFRFAQSVKIYHRVYPDGEELNNNIKLFNEELANNDLLAALIRLDRVEYYVANMYSPYQF